jgi:PST family polysaccharide transporter
MPLASALVAAVRVARLPRAPRRRPRPRELWSEWRSLLGLGVAVMAATVLSSLAQLATRALTTEAIDLNATGHFEAAWAISMTYIGFVLSAMGADYYPRLTAAVADREKANRLVNEQAEVALILAAPVLIGIVSFAPIVIHLLYSGEFAPAIEVLRLQVLGDVLKVAAWPMGFILLAHRANRAFFLTELLWNAVYVGAVWLLLPAIGLDATGAAFVIGYVFYTAMIYLVVARLQGFRPTRRVLLLLAATLTTAVAVYLVSRLDATSGLVLGAVATVATGIHSLQALLAMLQLEGRLGRMVSRLARLLRLRRR